MPEPDAHNEDTLRVEDPVRVAKLRFAEAVIGIVSHGVRLAFVAPILVSLLASAILAMAVTETDDRFLPPLLEFLPVDIAEDEDRGWDEIGRELAAPLLMVWFIASVALGLIERGIGLRLNRILPPWWLWLGVLTAAFATLAALTVIHRIDDMPLASAVVVATVLNLFCLTFASLAAFAVKLVSVAERGSIDLLLKRYGLERTPAD